MPIALMKSTVFNKFHYRFELKALNKDNTQMFNLKLKNQFQPSALFVSSQRTEQEDGQKAGVSLRYVARNFFDF